LLNFFRRPKSAETVFKEAAHALQNELLAGYEARTGFTGKVMPRLAKTKNRAYGCVIAFEGHARGHMANALVQAAINMRMDPMIKANWYSPEARTEMCRLAYELVSADQTLTPVEFATLVERWLECTRNDAPYASIVKVTERLIVEFGPIPEIEAALRKIKTAIATNHPYGYCNASERRELLRVECLLDPNLIGQIPLPEPWQVPFSDASWEPMLRYAMTATAAKMSTSWESGARQILDKSDTTRFLDQFDQSASAVAKMNDAVDALHGDMLRGLAWFASIEGSDRAATILGRLLIASSKKIEGIGAKSQKGFNSAAEALGRMRTFRALAELSIARNKVKQFGLSNKLIEILTGAAERQGMPIDELEELVVPSFGLELPGVRTETLGTVEAGIEIQGSDSAVIRWFKNGKELKSAPSEVKSNHTVALKELRQTLHEIESALPAQRTRIERMLLTGRTLLYPAWRERYIEHPLLADMTRRLIWCFSTVEGDVLGIPLRGVPTGVEGQPISCLGDETVVRLWAPDSCWVGGHRSMARVPRIE